MKKITTLLLTVILCFSLAACGKSQTQDESTTVTVVDAPAPETAVAQTQSVNDLLIGTWTCQRAEGQDNVTQATVYTIELYQGGTCYTYNLGKEDNTKYNNFSGTWTVTDNILVITYPKATLGFVIDMSVSPYTLTKQTDNSVVLQKVS